MKRQLIFIFFTLFFALSAQASYLLIPMDNSQKNHLKAYGVSFWVLQQDLEVDWLLNYRGGSFMIKYLRGIENELIVRGVSYEVIPDGQSTLILQEIANPAVNMDFVKLDKVPKIAVYSPKNKLPWDDAVTLVLTYAEIPYEVVYDEEVLSSELPKYDWLHLHHEDFTGQYGKFYASHRNSPWYKKDVQLQEATAEKLGYKKVSQMKLDVAKEIRNFTAGGGFLFAMCSGTDSYDIALAAEGIDVCDVMYDGDPPDQKAQSKLDFSKTFAFKDFRLVMNPYQYEYSNIDATNTRQMRGANAELDGFSLFEFSAKWDPKPTMLTQNHEQIIKGFMGQTTAFRKEVIKSKIIIMGESKPLNEARYIHGEYGYGTFTFYGGHDPEDYQHFVGEPPTDLNLHPNSPGYRLILNNILFPAAKKKKQKT
ncbi:MAG: hypothetical protein ACJATA_000050 [Sphingobacteriales bacterium]|jgi:hypothetical protein